MIQYFIFVADKCSECYVLRLCLTSLMPLHGISDYMDFAKWAIILATREEDEIKPAKITEVKII